MQISVRQEVPMSSLWICSPYETRKNNLWWILRTLHVALPMARPALIVLARHETDISASTQSLTRLALIQ